MDQQSDQVLLNFIVLYCIGNDENKIHTENQKLWSTKNKQLVKIVIHNKKYILVFIQSSWHTAPKITGIS